SETLKQQIASVQAEIDRLSLLISEYVGDTIVIKEDRVVNQHKEELWKLVSELLVIFSSAEPKTGIFKYVKEMNEVGYQRLFSCYDIGISRLIDILNQEIYKTETKNVKGRRARNVTTYKFENLESTIVKNNDKQEKEILKSILDDDSFSESKALTILHQLTDQGEEEWTLQ
ncbi:5417_t:CDS:2, partial [Cetraspora pellucida]